MGCGCGGGKLTVGHALFDCALPQVAAARATTAKHMLAAPVDKACSQWYDVAIAMQCRGTIAGTQKEKELTRGALGIVEHGGCLRRCEAHAVGVAGAAQIVRAAEAAARTDIAKYLSAAERRATQGDVLRAWRAV